MMKNNFIFIIVFITLFFSCQTQEEHAALDTPTSGSLTVFADAGLTSMLENQAYTFMKIYPNAKINFEYIEETNVIKSLHENKCKTIAISKRTNSRSTSTGGVRCRSVGKSQVDADELQKVHRRQQG